MPRRRRYRAPAGRGSGTPRRSRSGWSAPACSCRPSTRSPSWASRRAPDTEALLAVARSGYRPWQVVAYANDPAGERGPAAAADRAGVDGRLDGVRLPRLQLSAAGHRSGASRAAARQQSWPCRRPRTVRWRRHDRLRRPSPTGHPASPAAPRAILFDLDGTLVDTVSAARRDAGSWPSRRSASRPTRPSSAA